MGAATLDYAPEAPGRNVLEGGVRVLGRRTAPPAVIRNSISMGGDDMDTSYSDTQITYVNISRDAIRDDDGGGNGQITP